MSEKIQIRDRDTNAVLFECEAPADLSSGLRMLHALEKATQAGVSLAGANLDGANLDGANLDGANLARANLARANLDGASLAGAKFGDGVTAERGIRQVLGLQWPVTIFDNHMSIGCQRHSLADWAAFTKRDIVEMDGTDALLFWRRHKAMLLALAGHNEAVA